ncbi:MAG: MATE family efflux transporter [Myxococcota bacterium]
MPLTRTRVAQLAWPIVLAQIATALTGVVDTAVMGRVGTKIDLAAVAMASVTFSFVYWGFGFLRMSTTGQTAQARGAEDDDEARAVLVRALMLGAALGVGLFLAYPLIRVVSVGLFQAEPAVEAGAVTYMDARIWGAPAALTGFGVMGWLIGTGRTRELLVLQVVLNGLNAGLDALFVGVLDLGPAGIGAGTAMAEWSALGLGVFLVRDGLGRSVGLFDRARLQAMFTANRDILVRTLALLFAFAWFTNAGATEGSAVLAGNQVLLQFIAVSAFVLDAFAFVVEKEAGEAVGARDELRLRRAMRVTTELAVVCGAAFALAFWLGGGAIIRAFVADPEARAVALAYLPYCAVVPLLGVPAWQLDGLFLGATRGPALRDAALASTFVYVPLDLVLRPAFGNTGVWIAFLATYVLRAGTLSLGLPGLLREVRLPGADTPR